MTPFSCAYVHFFSVKQGFLVWGWLLRTMPYTKANIPGTVGHWSKELTMNAAIYGSLWKKNHQSDSKVVLAPPNTSASGIRGSRTFPPCLMKNRKSLSIQPTSLNKPKHQCTSGQNYWHPGLVKAFASRKVNGNFFVFVQLYTYFLE